MPGLGAPSRDWQLQALIICPFLLTLLYWSRSTAPPAPGALVVSPRPTRPRVYRP